MNRIIRVFPRRTSYTPDDAMAFIGDPPLFRPDADEIHVSVSFTWDIAEGKRLQEAWAQYYQVVRLGGPAIQSNVDGFTPGLYVRHGVTFTTRGCDNACPWCLVPEHEGKLVEIPNFASGHIIQDNNLLQASREHVACVFAMLKSQRKAAVFAGGLQSSLVDDWFCEQLRGIRVDSLFLAADTAGALRPLETAIGRLSFLGRKKLRVYVMIGMDETIDQATKRLQAVWDMGGLPFAQLYQPPQCYLHYNHAWHSLARTWSRPAMMFASQRRKAELAEATRERA